MTQEKPRRENLLKRAPYLSLHRKIKYTFSAKNSRLIFYRNFSIFVPHLSLENRATNMLFKTIQIVLDFCACTKIRIVCTVRNSERTSKIVSTLFYTAASKFVSIYDVPLSRFACCTVSQFWTKLSTNSLLDLRAAISLGIRANSQLKNVFFLFRNSLTLLFSLHSFLLFLSSSLFSSLRLSSLPSPSTCF